ncbi:hypothetical protein MANES_18G056901v8 [Manihot esculenta]|uniref:Uncharacterized protein n=1 Tax=Manihot esculenta TaxID=3983 RepID=A0ACB7FZP5_MANES|nr:hypothetical protein MANES_18G056901v8 [Manihot esculenta]
MAESASLLALLMFQYKLATQVSEQMIAHRRGLLTRKKNPAKNGLKRWWLQEVKSTKNA